jgi:hypothetical protein
VGGGDRAPEEADMQKLSDAEMVASRVSSAQAHMQITVGKIIDQNMLHQIVAGILGQHDSIASGKGGIGILIRQRDESPLNAENRLAGNGEELEPYLSIQIQSDCVDVSSDS